MMTPRQRKTWAAYLKQAGISFNFFSANLAREQNVAEQADEYSTSEEDEYSIGEEDDSAIEEETFAKIGSAEQSTDTGCETDLQSQEGDEDIKILTVEELENIFLSHAPENLGLTLRPWLARILFANICRCRRQDASWVGWLS